MASENVKRWAVYVQRNILGLSLNVFTSSAIPKVLYSFTRREILYDVLMLRNNTA